MKHNDAVIRQYCRAVGKRLPLPAVQRRQLLTGLREELTESAPDCTTLDALIAHVGTPDEAAQELFKRNRAGTRAGLSEKSCTGGIFWPLC